MFGCEVWLCKVLLHPGPVHRRRKLDDLNDNAHAAVLAKVASGDLAVLADGCIVEPVRSYSTELDAAAARELELRADPSSDWRVIVSVKVGQ